MILDGFFWELRFHMCRLSGLVIREFFLMMLTKIKDWKFDVFGVRKIKKFSDNG